MSDLRDRKNPPGVFGSLALWFWSRFSRIRMVRKRRYHLWLGRFGERVAEDYLRSRGYEILCRNFRYRKSEIDLIMRLETVLCFVEVKTRRWKPGVRPAEAVDTHKEKKIFQGGLGYLRRLGSPPLLVRFDIVEVLMSGRFPVEIRHWPGEVLQMRKK